MSSSHLGCKASLWQLVGCRWVFFHCDVVLFEPHWVHFALESSVEGYLVPMWGWRGFGSLLRNGHFCHVDDWLGSENGVKKCRGFPLSYCSKDVQKSIMDSWVG